MKNIYLIIFTLVALVLAEPGLVFAGCSGCDMTKSESADPAVRSKTVSVGNKICPVLGEPINEATKATYEYKGKIYNFCCASCIEGFKKEPQKYIDKINQEL